MFDLLFELNLTEEGEKAFFNDDFGLIAALNHRHDFFKIWQLSEKVVGL